MFKKMFFSLTIVLFLLASGQSYCQTEVLWSKYFHNICGVKFSKDGKVVVVASYDTLYLFDAYTGDPAMYEKLGMPLNHRENDHVFIDFTSDGNYIAAASMDTIRIWNFHTGEIFNTLFIPIRGGFHFIPNTLNFITKRYSNETEKWEHVIYNSENGDVIKSGTFISSLFNAWDMSPDGRYLVFSYPVESFKYGILLWDNEIMKAIKSLGYIEAYVNDIEFSPDGKYVASTDSEGYIKIWDLETYELIVNMLHTDNTNKELFAWKCKFTNDLKYLITGGGYFTDKTTKIWLLPEMELVKTYEHKFAAFSSFDISPNDSLIVGDFYDHLVSVVDLDCDNSSTNNDNLIQNELLLIPNPVKDILTIEMNNKLTGKFNVIICDVKGTIIKRINSSLIDFYKGNISFDVSFLSSGTYFVQIDSEIFSETYSFIKI